MATPPNRLPDILGQFPQLKSYNQGLLIFPLSPNVSQDAVVTALQGAIAQIITRVPWLGGQVAHEKGSDGSSGSISVIPLPSGRYDNKILYVKDCTEVCPSYEELSQKGAPVSMLDGKVFFPFPGFPMSYHEAKIGPPPAVVVQASFIKNGVILNFANQHNVMDGTRVFAFISLFAAAMQGKELDQSIVDQANMDPAKVIPLLEPGEPIRDHSHLFKVASLPMNNPPAPAKWAVLRVPRTAIPKIKASASDKQQFVPLVAYTSSNDALCAFYWKRLASVRVTNGTVDPSSVSKFSRAIDVRSAVDVPFGHMGQMVYHAATRFSYRELASEELTISAMASRMRADLNESNNEWAVRSYATFLASVRDKSQLMYGGGIDPALDIGSSSMSQMSTEVLHFGILGKPRFVRRPNLLPLPGLMYAYPLEGKMEDLPVLVCLNEKDMEGLKSDEEWSSVSEFIG